MKFTEEHIYKITKIRNLCDEAIDAEKDENYANASEHYQNYITGKAMLAQHILNFMNGVEE